MSGSNGWMGFIPSHWVRKKLKYVASLKSGESITSDEIADSGQYPVFGGNGFRGYTTEYTHCGKYILIGRQGALCGNINYASGCFWASEHAVVVEIKDGSEFIWLGELLRAMNLNQYSQSAAQPGLAVDVIANLEIPVPPIEEQRSISVYLDRETARMDGLIAKKRRLIELLREKGQAVISHAVTKGLDPNAPMKDSGIELLGQIPAHWDVKPLMYLTPDTRRIMYGIVLPGPHFEGGVPIVKGGDVAPGKLRVAALNRTDPEIEVRYERSRLRGGDLVYAIRGSIGAVELVPDELEGANLTQDAARVAPREGVNRRWLLHALRASPIFGQLEAGAVGATIRGINIRELKRARLPVPPPEEQQAITGFCDPEDRLVAHTADTVEKAIGTLEEHRAALIAAAVTGKIDVRAHPTDAVEAAD